MYRRQLGTGLLRTYPQPLKHEPARPQPAGALAPDPAYAELLDAAFSKRLQFGVQLGTDAIVSVHAGFLWCPSCGARTTIITFINLAFGPNRCSFTIRELGERAVLLNSVLSRLPDDLEIGRIKPRFSRIQHRSYMSNGCFHCDALIGEFFEHDAWDGQETVSVFSIRISEQWQAAIENHSDYETAWSVCRLARGSP